VVTAEPAQKVSFKMFLGIAILSFWLLSGCALNNGMKSNELKSFAGGAVGAFATTVYPIVQNYCISCHGVDQSPMFAQSNIGAAYKAALAAVSFVNPATSRMVTQLAANQHNCWGDCSANSQELAAAIQKWIALEQGPGGPDTRIKLIAQLIPASIPSQATLPAANQWLTLTFPLDIQGLSGATFTIEIQEFLLAPPAAGSENYRVRNPRLNGLPAPATVKSLRLLINGLYRPNEADYNVIDATVPPPGALLVGTPTAASEMFIVKDQGPGTDTIQPSFEILTP
jgi:hypothetical protein